MRNETNENGRKRVLFADDDQSIREIYSRIAQVYLKDIEATVVVNGREVVEKVTAQRYHMIVIDYEMPEVTGPDAIDELRSRGYNLPTLLVSGKRGAGDEAENIKIHFMGKPFSPRELADKIKTLLADKL